MITSAFTETDNQAGRPGRKNTLVRIIQRLASLKFVREAVTFAGFTGLTAVMTWPWVTRLRDACADQGDPSLVSWILWWDYHQTFTAPLHLFDANIFYPLRQTLAFSENDYGIALLFFPLFALGLQPLTVNSVATFLGFAFCGYGAFRLTRTLTGSNWAACIAGLVFAFIPYRFHLLSQLHYVFTGWMPLTLEGLVLFARERSRKRAAWLGIAFTMNGLSCLSWFILSLVPLGLSLVFLSVRYGMLRDRKFWARGGVAALASLLVLLPFMLPYYQVSKAHNFTWEWDVIARNSSSATRWLVAEYRNRLWKGFGDSLPGNGPRLFTGLLPPLLALAALLLPGGLRQFSAARAESRAASDLKPESVNGAPAKWRIGLDALALTALTFAVLSLGWAGVVTHPRLGRFFAGPTLIRSLTLFVAAIAVRFAVAYPAWLRRTTGAPNLIQHLLRLVRGESLWRRVVWVTSGLLIWLAIIALFGGILFVDWRTNPFVGRFLTGPNIDRVWLVLGAAIVGRLALAYPLVLRRATGARNLIEHIRESPRGDAIWLGAIWAVTGFLMSLGTNTWLFRILYDSVFLFRGMREPSRAAMVANLGLAVLAGVGAVKFAHFLTSRGRKQLRPAVFVSVIALALLFEMRVAPMRIERGSPYPDEITLRLKQTPMKGGLVELPTGGGILPHLYMLRAADHQKPLINAISTFVPPHAWEIESLSRATPISIRLLDAMEKVPTSYLVIHTPLIEPERRAVYEAFLSVGVSTGRLRFINRFGPGDDLYAVVRTEPEAKAEASLPFELSIREWAGMIREDPVNLLVAGSDRSQTLYRIYLASSGAMPRYAEFIRDSEIVAKDVILASEDEDRQFQISLGRFTEDWVRRDPFIRSFGGLDDAHYVDRLLENAGLRVDPPLRATLTAALGNGQQTRAGVLLQIVNHPAFVEKENDRSLVLLHYFGYLRRNPDDPPDRDLTGFEFWIRDLKRSRSPGRLSYVFKDSIEYQSVKKTKVPGVR
jgi:hypothetical protein